MFTVSRRHLLSFLVILGFLISTSAQAQIYEHWMTAPEIPDCETTQPPILLEPGLTANASAGHLRQVYMRFEPELQHFTAYFTVSRCKGFKPTGIKFNLRTNDTLAGDSPAVVIDASHMYGGDFLKKPNPLPSTPIVTVFEEAATPKLLASNHPSYAGDKSQIREALVEEQSDGTRTFRIVIDTRKINNPAYKPNWKGLAFRNSISYLAYPQAKQKNTFCTGESGEPSHCAGNLGAYKTACWANGVYDRKNTSTNTVPECYVRLPGSAQPLPETQCVVADAGKTFTAQIVVVDPDQNQKKLIQFASGEGRLNPGNISAGQVTDVSNTANTGSYSLAIPATGFKEKYTAEFFARDDAHPSAESGWGSGQCVVSVCPRKPDPTPTPTPTLTPPPPCDRTDITNLLFILDSNVAAQKRYVNISLAMLKRNTKGQGAFMRAVRQRSEEIYLSAWNATWTIPRIILDCPDNITCVTVSHTAYKTQHRKDVLEMHELLRSVVRRLRQATDDRSRGERLMDRSGERMVETEAALKALPDERDDCR